MLGGEERAGGVEQQHALEVLDRLQSERRQAAATTGVGDDAVEGAGRLGGGRHDALDVVLLGDVADHVAHAAAVLRGLLDLLDRRAQRRLGAPADRDRGAVGGGHPRAGGADPGAAAGDEHPAALQATRGLQLCRHRTPPIVPSTFRRRSCVTCTHQ